MAILHYNGVGITALSGAVPRRIIDNLNYTTQFGAAEVQDVVDKIGVYQRRFADAATCSSDLCYAAAEQLIADNTIDRSEIDVLIFISQTPDYRMPATSVLLQHRLGLNQECMAFDINLGCSAFLYGMSVAFSLLQQPGIRKALILDGETRSKVYSAKDRRTAFLFGDAGVAALVERNPLFGDSFFSFHSDGSKEDLIKIPAGGYRNPSSEDTLREKTVDEFGNIRTDEQGYMNGGDVFNFVIRSVPADIKVVMQVAELTDQQVDFYVFHQANKFINDYLARKLKLDHSKLPSTIQHFGNTSSVSVPLTIVTELHDQFEKERTMVLSAFGVGMTWATATIHQPFLRVSKLIEI